MLLQENDENVDLSNDHAKLVEANSSTEEERSTNVIYWYDAQEAKKKGRKIEQYFRKIK
jgi:hypothetical protein